jgi:glycosyltransferase involved in cell wall biosynthesis
MKFHALLPVRDEADIIGQSLRHLLSWADAVYVFDTGSTDDTWEIVCQFAAEDKRVFPLKKDSVFFSDKRLRSWMFHQARQQMQDGDWFLRVDADEFHHISPPEFVKTRMQKHETVAYHQYYDFRLTHSEVRDWDRGRETLMDRGRPIEDRRRWFTASLYTEPRLCRYRPSMRWPDFVSFPYNAGYLALERLPIRHYPHRDPVQLARRCCLRAAMTAYPENSSNSNWTNGDWRRHVVPDDLPDLHFWKPGTDLTEVHFRNHLAPFCKRAIQRLAHGCLLPLLDRFRASYPDSAFPQPISSGFHQKLELELAPKINSP